jgi:hypothetical protein
VDNESIRRVLHLSDSEYKSMVEYQKKAELSTVLFCDLHEREYFDFEKQCDECIREQLEFEAEVKQREKAWRESQ